MKHATSYYVYRLTHITEGRHYIGARTSHRLAPHMDLGHRYFTSSKELRPIFKAHPENFRIKIVRQFDTWLACLAFEQKYQRRVRAHRDDRFYNKSIAGRCPRPPVWNRGLQLPKQSIESNLKRSAALHGRPAPNKGLTASLETRRKMSLAHGGNGEIGDAPRRVKVPKTPEELHAMHIRRSEGAKRRWAQQKLVGPERVELTSPCLKGRCSDH